MRPAHFTGIALVVLSTLAFLVGMLWAGCDVGMRPFVLELAPFFFLNPVVAVSVVALSALAAICLEGLRRRVEPMCWLLIVVALFATVPVTAIGTFDIATTFGVHPHPGNCVI